MLSIFDLLKNNQESDPSAEVPAPKTSSQYTNAPMDPRANQKDILSELIAAGQKPNQDLLSDILYNYDKTPQDNMQAGAGLALDLPGPSMQQGAMPELPPAQKMVVAKGKEPRMNQPQATVESPKSMTDEGYMDKMLREQDQSQNQDVAQAEVAQAEQKVEELTQTKPEGDPELVAAQQLAADRRSDLLFQLGMNQMVSGAVGAPQFDDPTKNAMWQQYQEEPTTNLSAIRKSAKDKKDAAREDERFGMDKQKFALDQEKGKLDLDKAREDMADSQEGKDPNSELSQGFKSFLAQNAKMAGVTLDPEAMSKLSYAQLSKLNGAITNMFTTKMAADAKRDAAKESALNREANRENKLTKESNDRTQALRKEASAGEYGKIYGNYLNADRNRKIIEAFSKNPTGYSDYGTLMGSLKVLQGDQSVVREAEIKLGMNAGSLMDTIQNTISRPATGKSLTTKQRQAIMEAMNIMHSKAKDQYLSNIEPLLQQADDMGIDRKFILPSALREEVAPEEKGSKKSAETTSTPATDKFTANQEKAIELVMSKNKVDRSTAVNALKKAGKL